MVIISIIKVIPKDLRIHFLDVGQGDSTFIETPKNKTILIDGGGSMSKNFDVGKSTLLPYILDRGYTKIDYVIISHFDQDHVGGILTILEELTVEKVIIAKQNEESENYKKFLEIVNQNKIKVIEVEAGDKIKIEEDIYFDIIWPLQNQITQNVLNNNAIVAKLNYKKISMLFTGDIEEIAEKEILKKYENTKILNSTILKIAHHGSKTSTTDNFLSLVNPQIALIGVGENNLFNHPAVQTIQKLKDKNVKIFRTDEKGEITLYINTNGKINIV